MFRFFPFVNNELVKKFVMLVCIAVMTVVLVGFYSPVEMKRYADILNAEYRVYTTQAVGEEIFSVNGETVYLAENNDVSEVSETVGEELEISGDVTRMKELLVLFVVVSYEVQQLDGVTVVTGRSRKLDGDGNNLQMAFSGGTIKIGTPALLGSY